MDRTVAGDQPGPVTAAGDPPERAERTAAPLTQAFERAGTLVRLQRHQQLALSPSTSDCSYLVRTGTIALETSAPRRHIVGFWHASDLLEARQVADLLQLSMRAVTACELWRVRQRPRNPLFTELPDVLRVYLRLSATTLRRLVVANMMLGTLTAQERVVSFLISNVVRLGHIRGNRAECAMPMSRADIADHLGLNPDTLSRIAAGLQSASLIEPQGRRRLVVRDWQALCAHTPLAAALTDIS